MSIIIRQEEPQDFEAVFGLIRQAFEGEEHSDHREQFLVERLRNSDAFVPELSLVAETGGTLAGAPGFLYFASRISRIREAWLL